MLHALDYSPDEIFTLATGRELDALVAVRFFGWRWMKYQAPNHSKPHLLTGLFPPDAPGRWCVANYYDRIWQSSDRHAPRFSGWDNCPWWDDEGRVSYSGFPHYSTNMADAWLVVEILREQWSAATDGVSGLNDDFARPFDDGAFFDHLHRHADRRWPWAMLYLTPDAICRAALLASDFRPEI